MLSGRRRQRSSGFTFIEAVVTMLIVGACAVGLMTAFTMVNRHTADAGTTITASLLARAQLERISADKAFKGYPYIAQANYPSPEILDGPFTGYRRITTIREVAMPDLATAQPGSGIKRIDIEITWGPTATERLRVTTLVTQY